MLKHSTARTVNDGLGGKAANNFNAMVAAAGAVAADPGNMAKYDALCRMLDIDNFIADLLAHWYATNWDWPEKNWYATHRSPDGLWRFHTWDAEHSMEFWNTGQNVLGLSVNGIHDRLKTNAGIPNALRRHGAQVLLQWRGAHVSPYLPTCTAQGWPRLTGPSSANRPDGAIRDPPRRTPERNGWRTRTTS